MSSRGRNIITGVVVLGAIGVFLWMVLQFTGRATAAFAGKGIPVAIIASRGDGVSEGTPVLYRGVQVGKIDSVARAEDNLHIRMAAELDRNPPLPRDLEATIRIQSMLGTSAVVELSTTGIPTGQVTAGEEIPAVYAGIQLLPPEFSDVLADVRQKQLIKHTDEAIVAMRDQLQHAGELIDSLKGVIGDPKTQSDLKTAIANMKHVTERADRIGANLETFTSDLQKISANASSTLNDMHKTIEHTGGDVDALSRHLTDDIDKMGKVLDQFQQVAAKINNGHGTAGQLLNDPALYDQLTDTAKELNLVSKSLQRLIEQWEQDGLSLKVK
ncbi:MAG TPA: MlaD family protein [Tepidisphaeraceae bacterium]|nr:MlaD family protein [Tepidisphaeraceae bacterium]